MTARLRTWSRHQFRDEGRPRAVEVLSALAVIGVGWLLLHGLAVVAAGVTS